VQPNGRGRAGEGRFSVRVTVSIDGDNEGRTKATDGGCRHRPSLLPRGVDFFPRTSTGLTFPATTAQQLQQLQQTDVSQPS